jgi:hypothetical protein
MRVEDLERKKRECGERERGKKGESERKTYERIQNIRKKKKVKKSNYFQVEFLGQ